MGYKRRSKNHRPRSSTFGLNITSMTDMFTILLVFLLQTYSTADFQVEMDQGLRLPQSNAQSEPTRATQMTLTTTELKLENRTIVSLANSEFVSSDLESNDSNFIKPLFAELEKLAKTETGANKASIEEGKLILKADSRLSYDTLRKVMYTASMAGFPKLKLATVVGE